FYSSRRRHTRWPRDWSSDVCSSDLIGSVIYSLGLSPVVILATDLIVGSAPVERAGAASAISETSSELGGALGIAVLGSIGVAVRSEERRVGKESGGLGRGAR